MNPQRWIPLLVILFIVGAVFRVPLLTAFTVMLIVVILLSRWWQRRSLDGVSYVRRPYYRRGFPGEETNLRLEVENRKLLPISWLRTQDPWPKAIGPDD